MSSSDKSYQLHLIISPMVQLTHITTQFSKLKRKGFVCSNNCLINIKLVKNQEASDLGAYCLYAILFWFALMVVHWHSSCLLLVAMIILSYGYWMWQDFTEDKHSMIEQNGNCSFESLGIYLSIIKALKWALLSVQRSVVFVKELC